MRPRRDGSLHAGRALPFLLALSGGVGSARGQVPPPPAPAGGEVLSRVGIDQKLDERIPLDLEFRDEEGRPFALRRAFDRGPVVLALVYYRCPMLCNMTLNGMLAAFKTLRLTVGRDFQVVTVSFDPRETPQAAAAKKGAYLRLYGRPEAPEGWRFLTGDESAVRALAAAVGFRYHHDAATDQYAHASGIMVLTPEGRLSRYLYGLEYSARDLQLALVEASRGAIGSLADQVLLFCYRYDPASGKYGFAIMSVLRALSLLTLGFLAVFVARGIRRERRAAALHRGPAPPRGEEGNGS